MSKYAPIKIKKSHEGDLHHDLGIPEGKTIPMADKEKAAHSKDPAERKRGQFAVNAAGFSKYRPKG